MSWEDFTQMISNANSPAFYNSADEESAFDAIFGDLHLDDERDIAIARGMVQRDGWLGEKMLETAKDAAWDTLQSRLGDEPDDENENA